MPKNNEAPSTRAAPFGVRSAEQSARHTKDLVTKALGRDPSRPQQSALEQRAEGVVDTKGEQRLVTTNMDNLTSEVSPANSTAQRLHDIRVLERLLRPALEDDLAARDGDHLALAAAQAHALPAQQLAPA